MILVTGASGFLGSELVKQLVANGESVRIIVRPSSDISHLASIKDKIEIMEGDILDVPSLEIAMDGIEKIYHSAAVIGYDDSFYDSHVQMQYRRHRQCSERRFDKRHQKAAACQFYCRYWRQAE
jgi:uncharacterized protein YbjT (DUF2867 family)